MIPELCWASVLSWKILKSGYGLFFAAKILLIFLLVFREHFIIWATVGTLFSLSHTWFGGWGIYINFLTKIVQNLVAVKFHSSALGCRVSALLSANSLSFPQGSTVCLADFCDIFRCEVFESQRKDYFWEKKLCKEDKLMVRRRRCEVAGASISKTTFWSLFVCLFAVFYRSTIDKLGNWRLKISCKEVANCKTTGL